MQIMASTLPATKMERTGNTAAATRLIPPTAASEAAAFEERQPKLVTHDTTNGLRINPALPPVARRALAVAPAWKYLTAMSSRKVELAVSNTPIAAARRRS